MKLPFSRRAIVFFILAAVSAGCAIFGGSDKLVRAKGYFVSPPAGWRELDRGESDRAFRLKSGALATFVGSCNRNSDASLEILTRHLLIGMRSIQYQSQTRATYGGGEALVSRLKGTEDGVRFNLEVAVVKKEGCVFDFTLVSPKEIPAAESAEFQAFLRSFRHGN